MPCLGDMSRRRAFTVAVLVTAAALAVGCVAQDQVSCDASTVTLGLSIRNRALEPSDPAACRDQQVRLRVTADEELVIHIHGYDNHATQLAAGVPAEVSFRAERSGQFPIEIHPIDDPAGIEVGILTIHEP